MHTGLINWFINHFGITIFRTIWILWNMSAFHDPAEPDWTREILIHLHASFPVWSMKRWSGGGVARCACRRRSRCGECCFPAVAPSLPCALQCWSKHQLLLFLGGRRQRWSVASPFPGQSALWTLTLRPLRWVKPALYAPVFCVLAPLYAWGALKCAFFSPAPGRGTHSGARTIRIAWPVRVRLWQWTIAVTLLKPRSFGIKERQRVKSVPVRRCGSRKQRCGVPVLISPFDTSACHLSSYLGDGCFCFGCSWTSFNMSVNTFRLCLEILMPG